MENHKKSRSLSRFDVVLLIAAVYLVLKGLSFMGIIATFEPVPKGIELITSFVPLKLWGLIWIAIGLNCLRAAWMSRGDVAFGFLSGLLICWGTAYLYGTIENLVIGPSEAGVVLDGLGYLFAGLVVALLGNKAACVEVIEGDRSD